MSTQSVKQFLAKAETAPDLQKRLKAIPKGGGQWTIAEIVKIAATAGFQFTPQDYEDAVNEVLTAKHAAGELNDAELALVSGGLMCVSSDGTTCLCCPNPKPKDPGTHPVMKM
ncbi:MAG TPA: Nif11-like leader peptide family natural product precursor [Lacipirellulaceae bacterium]|nr:Nif11-like leader peptide family natural product precursor [Lacipirellulaceae bacterium]